MNDQTPVLLDTVNLHKQYRMGGENLHVLRGVKLAVTRGQWLAIVGASGSGKSTLLHLLGGLDRPDRGTVSFAGRDIFTGPGRLLDRYRSSSVGFVFQFYHLLPELTALENVLIGAMIAQSIFSWPGVHTGLRRRAEHLLEQMGLSGRLKHKPHKLSGGERQRIAIARALINDPPILLADEPTGNLDSDTGKHLLDVLHRFHEAGQTIVMVTHDKAVAAASNRQLILEQGKLAER